MHAGPLARIPLAIGRPLDLRGQLQQQPVIGLLSDRLDAERQAVLVGGERQRDRGDAAEVGERRKGKVAPEIAEPVQHGRIVADRQILRGADLRRRQCRDRRQDDVPLLEEGAEAARGGVEHRLHPRPVGKAHVPARLPDPHVNRFDEIGRRLRQPARGEHVADHDRKIADVAGGLRRKGFAIIQIGQGVIDVMTEAFKEAPDPLQLGRDLRRRLVFAPFVRQRDFQPVRIAHDHPRIWLRRTPERHEFARRRTAAGVDEGRGVAHRARLAALDGDQPAEVGQKRRQREHAARDLQPDIAVDPAEIRIEPPPSVACAIGTAPAATIAALPADEPQVV